jgi:hypothetical protein
LSNYAPGDVSIVHVFVVLMTVVMISKQQQQKDKHLITYYTFMFRTVYADANVKKLNFFFENIFRFMTKLFKITALFAKLFLVTKGI